MFSLYRLLKCVHFIWGFKYFQNDCGVCVVVRIMLLNILQIFFCDDRACHDVGGVVLTQLITADPTPVLGDQYQVSRDHQPGVPASQLSPTVSDCCCCWLPTFFSLSETISHHILTHLHSTSHHTYILIISNKHCLLFTIMYWYMLRWSVKMTWTGVIVWDQCIALYSIQTWSSKTKTNWNIFWSTINQFPQQSWAEQSWRQEHET